MEMVLDVTVVSIAQGLAMNLNYQDLIEVIKEIDAQVADSEFTERLITVLIKSLKDCCEELPFIDWSKVE